MTTARPRVLEAMRRLASTPTPAFLAPALFFGLGIAFSLALRQRLYANAVVALLALTWAAGVLRGRLAPPLAAPQAAGARPSLDEAAERVRLRMMLDQTPAPLVLSGADGGVHAVNRAARTLFGSDDLIVPAPEALIAAMAAELPGNRAVLRLACSSGGAPERSYALRVAIVGGAGGSLRLGVLTDIQSELQAAEAAALRKLLQVLSHELMNSLTPIASLAESAHAILVEDGAGSVARAAEALEVIRRRSQGLDGFIAGYRALARLPPPVLAPVNVPRLLEDAAVLFRERWGPHGTTLVVDRPVPDVAIACDAGQVTQALLNLLANAAEAALAGQSDTRREVCLAARLHGDGLDLLVSDSGPGVPAGQENMIFDPFYTTKAGGDGIGLALARQIALAHGGTLQLVAPGRLSGATMAFSLWTAG